MSPQDEVKPPAEDDPARTSTSFVYPVRSLLSGIRAQSSTQGTTFANAVGLTSQGECAPQTGGDKDLDIGITEARTGAHTVAFVFLGLLLTLISW